MAQSTAHNPANHGPVIPDRFLTFAQFAWHNFEREFEHYDLADVMHMLAPPRQGDKQVKYSNLGGFCLNVTPNVPFPELNDGNVRQRWHEQVEALRRVGRPFDFFGIFRGGKRPEGPGYDSTECSMLKEDYDYMMSKVADLFIGWDMGEWDGLYGRDEVFYMKPDESPKSRQEAYDRFMAYLRRLHGYVYENACTIVGCTFPHYFHELPIRLLGAEVGQGLLNYQVYTSFLRGAERQYGLKSKIITSVFDRWGYTLYARKGVAPCSMPDGEGNVYTFRADEHAGHSIGLHVAMWLSGYFAGAAIMGLDGGYYTDEVDARGVRQLSPLGKVWMSFREWARNPSPRGQQVRPLALLLDYHCGWTPPRHLYSMKHHTVWHSLPYGPCDYGMDRAYDLFYPGYTDSGFFRDERGFITPTPCGDCADVLLSDATVDHLAAYPIIWHLSDEIPDAAFLSRLRAYVEQGGHLIVSGAPLVALARDWFGLDVPDASTAAVSARCDDSGEEVREGYFHVRRLVLDAAWRRVAATEAGDPLIASRPLGRGCVTVLAADHGLTDKLVALGLDMNPRWNYTPEAPYELLHAVQRFIQALVRTNLPLTTDQAGIYFGVNKLDNGDLIACLYNPGHEPLTATLNVRGRHAKPAALPGCWPAAKLNGHVVTLPANQTTVVTIARRPSET